MNEKPREQWKVVSEYRLAAYPCGVRAGERVVLRNALEMTQEGKPTGEVYKAGSVWKVLLGYTGEPSVIWLRNPDGEEHTWEDSNFWEYFDRTHDDAHE